MRMIEDFGGKGEVSFQRQGVAGIITLHRPEALNALTYVMLLAIEKALRAWENDPGIERVIIVGQGRAFSAGGDIVEIYKAGRAGNPPFGFFADEYRTNAYIERYSKPIVSMYNGIVMGGGAGISVHGSHRVFSENAGFAMPEVGIGFFPDVGGSYFLPRLPDEYGLYMALTGRRVGWGDALKTGLATQAVAASDFPKAVEALSKSGATDEILAQFSVLPQPETGSKDFADIATWFSANALPHLVECVSLAAENSNSFAAGVLKNLRRNSPTSLSIAFRQIRTGAELSMEECMAMEFRIVSRMLVGHDFYEGIRAAVIDKDRNPQWKPVSLDAINPADIDGYFAPLGEKELTIP